MRLSTMNVDGVCELLTRIDELSAPTVLSIQAALKESNIGGKVLSLCDLGDLKQVSWVWNMLD